MIFQQASTLLAMSVRAPPLVPLSPSQPLPALTHSLYPPLLAHLNLRERFQPYKQLVAEVLLDKNPQIRTIINKTADVGTESAFRTFSYEVLAGPVDLDVEVRENQCVYRFDYAKVYWNSKLEKEHTRLINLFQPGEVVCDVMAGIGPFAVPAGKKGVFVWANDMNPDSYHYLQDSITRNKVQMHYDISLCPLPFLLLSVPRKELGCV